MPKKPTRSQLEDQLKRSLADYQNLKKRLEADRNNLTRWLAADILNQLLPVLADLERAQKHLNDPGLKLALDKFKAILTAEGVEEIKLLQQPFDPKLAECLELIKGKKDLVLEVIEKGYWLQGKVLRPARVKVGKG